MTRKGIVAGEPDHTGLGRRSQQLQRLLRRSRPDAGRHERPEAADGQAELEGTHPTTGSAARSDFSTTRRIPR
jgi:hypothetical protein